MVSTSEWGEGFSPGNRACGRVKKRFVFITIKKIKVISKLLKSV